MARGSRSSCARASDGMTESRSPPQDVKCTWDLLTGRAPDKLRANPRKSWWSNIAEVVIDAPTQATFVLKRPQPAILALFASGLSPIYPCHVPAAQMRQRPIGTGPFKFVEFRPNQSIKLARNPEYWKPGRPYLDGVEYTIVPNRSTAILAFIAGQFDLTFPYEVTIPLLKDVKQQAPQAICELVPANSSTNLLVNRQAPPFDNADLRRALALALDRRSFIDILAQAQGDIGAAMEPPPSGVWGMPEPELASCSRLWPGPGEEPGCGARDHDGARPWTGQASRDQDCRAQHPDLSRPGFDPGRPVEGNLGRRHVGHGRDRELVPQARPQGLPDRRQQHRQRGRRSRPAILRELRLRLRAQLYRLLQQGTGGIVRRAIDASPIRSGARSWSGRSTASCSRMGRGRSSTTPVSQPACSRRSRA